MTKQVPYDNFAPSQGTLAGLSTWVVNNYHKSTWVEKEHPHWILAGHMDVFAIGMDLRQEFWYRSLLGAEYMTGPVDFMGIQIIRVDK